MVKRKNNRVDQAQSLEQARKKKNIQQPEQSTPEQQGGEKQAQTGKPVSKTVEPKKEIDPKKEIEPRKQLESMQQQSQLKQIGLPKLARDRQRRKSRIKAVIFFLALISIFTGIFLNLKDSVESQDDTMEDVDTLQYQSINPFSADTEGGNSQSNSENNNDDLKPQEEQHSEPEPPPAIVQIDDNATSYDDELSDKDDEVDQIEPEKDDDFGELPKAAQDAVNDLLDVADQAKRIRDQFTHTVVRGDTLKDVLELSGLEDETSQKLIASFPEFKNLKAGQQVYWILDNENELEYLNWLVSEKEERIYERLEDGKFKRNILEKKSVWKRDVIKGEIGNSFNGVLKKLGLENRQIAQLNSALQWQVNIRKFQKGDKFALLVSREYLGDKLTGQGNVEAIHIITQGKSYYAIQAENGRYYNRKGETIGKGFARYPIQRQARISSPFNPRRKHPVTGRIAPHKGVDFAMPSGTPVIAPADGIIEKVAYQASGAGRYIIVRHSREYQTVYMHLSKPMVQAGQTVKRGQRIALSGNTGRSTGPHLHYEFHINGRPVNPITVKLPGTNTGLGTEERRKFLTKAKTVERQLKL